MVPGGDQLDEPKLQRYRRQLAFASAFANARRREFDLLWRERHQHGPRAEKAEEFMRRVEGLLGLIQRGQQVLGIAERQGTVEALATLARFDLGQLNVATRGLEQLARGLKEDPGLAASVTGRLGGARSSPLEALATGELDPHEATQMIVGMVRAWFTPKPPVVQATPPPPVKRGPLPAGRLGPQPAGLPMAAPAPPPPPPAPAPTPAGKPMQAPPKVLDQRRLLDAAVELVHNVVERVTPRLQLVQVSLDATGLPTRRKAWPDVERHLPEAAPRAGVAPAQLAFALMTAELFYRDDRAVQLAHTALTQWRQARMLLFEARELQTKLDNATSPSQLMAIGHFHVGKFKATAFPLSHLHMSFRGLVPLQELFPPPPPG